jgi:DNA-binding transcriptional ArsR family regulator
VDELDAITAFAALAHPGRLAAFRLLVRAGPDGLPAGKVATSIGLKQNTTSVHLATLAQAGLVHGQREGRSVRFRADYATAGGLIAYLLEDCCNGRSEVSAPIARLLACMDNPEQKDRQRA